jgi:hypothetical protein
MRHKHTDQAGTGAERHREVFADADKMRKLDRLYDGNHKAIRPVLTQHPGIDFIMAGKTSRVDGVRPMAQHPPNKPPLVLHP